MTEQCEWSVCMTGCEGPKVQCVESMKGPGLGDGLGEAWGERLSEDWEEGRS